MHPGQVPPPGYQPVTQNPSQTAYPAPNKVPPGYPQGPQPPTYQQNGQSHVPPGYPVSSNGQANFAPNPPTVPSGYQQQPQANVNGQANFAPAQVPSPPSVPSGYQYPPAMNANNQPSVPSHAPNPPTVPPGYQHPPQMSGIPQANPPSHAANQPNIPPGYQQPTGNPQANVPPGFPPNQPNSPSGFSQYPQKGFPQQNFPSPGPPGFPQPGFGPPQAGMPPGYPPAVPGSSGDPYGQAPRRLDLSALPSAVQVFEDDRNTRSGPFPTGYASAEHPPLSTTDFDAQDQGNSNPKFIRSSLYCVPQTSDILKNTGIPFALSINPFAQLSENEHPLPVVDLGDLGPIRCQRCQAYMSPFMDFVDGGRKFRCALCHTASTVDEMYFAHLDHTGRRTDIQHRPELYLGSYEFIATKKYCKNEIPPKQPVFMFLLDVSYNSVRNGLVQLFCDNFSEVLRNLPKDYNQSESSIRVGFATYDQAIHFYNLNNDDKAEMLISNDLTDVFVPFIEGFFVTLNEAEANIRRCMKQVVATFSQTRITEPMLGPAIQTGIEALRSGNFAGKVFVFHSSIPTFDAPGRVKNREDRKVLGTEKEKTQLTPAIDFYTKLGEQCITVGCSVDLFLFPNSNVDLASIAPVSTISGGTVYKYQYFDAERDGLRFVYDLVHNLERQVAFDCMVRVRTSTGIRPTGFFGNFFMNNTTDIEVGTLDSDKGISIEIKYDDKLDEQVPAVIQVAVLFTSCGGQRRLRIHNIRLPVSSDYQMIYRCSDIDTVVDHFFKYAVKTVREKTQKEVKDELTQRCAQILATYREKCSSHSPLSQLVLPETLKLLPLFVNCILRNDAVGSGSEMTVDDRVWLMTMVPSLRVDLSIRYLYPQILTVSKLTDGINETKHFNITTMTRASYEFLDRSEIYLIDNGMIGFIWAGHATDQQLVQDVFNVPSLQSLNSESHVIPVCHNPRNLALHGVCKFINNRRPYGMKMFIIRESDTLESWMKKFLVEDKYATGNASYVDFLCEVHRAIRLHFA